MQEFLMLLHKYCVKYLIIGGEAVIYYGYPRLTGDMDIFYENSAENIGNLFKMLDEFWDGNIPEIENIEELAKPGLIVQFGVPPNRIDLLNKITNIEFSKAWGNRKVETIKFNKNMIPIYYIGLDELIKNKKAVNRPKDMEDLKYLERRKGNR
ncbi:MAG: DUF6036 family nucleotidyltransferase [bacterium]